MALIDKVLEVPGYGWQTADGELIKPSKAEIMKVAFARCNIFKTRKNWMAPMAWIMVFFLLPAPVLFFGYFISWPTAIVAALYGMIVMNTHSTVWYHRYSTHRAFKFRNKFWRAVTQNLVVKIFPEELYVVSHHVHHVKSDKPGDPYNAQGGFLYCFLADINHQAIAKDLSETEYAKTTQFLSHTGIYINSFKQYLKWGSVSHPLFTIALWFANWAAWYGIGFLIAGHGLSLALFTGALISSLAVRTFNYQGHGMGEDKRKDGVDYNWKDMSINQSRPGLLGGEWHNNHHLYPNSARAGFLPHQIDNAWVFIWLMHKIGVVTSYRDSKQEFLKQFYIPNRKAENTRRKPAKVHERQA